MTLMLPGIMALFSDHDVLLHFSKREGGVTLTSCTRRTPSPNASTRHSDSVSPAGHARESFSLPAQSHKAPGTLATRPHLPGKWWLRHIAETPQRHSLLTPLNLSSSPSQPPSSPLTSPQTLSPAAPHTHSLPSPPRCHFTYISRR